MYNSFRPNDVHLQFCSNDQPDVMATTSSEAIMSMQGNQVPNPTVLQVQLQGKSFKGERRCLFSTENELDE